MEEEKTRYSKEELEEFKEIILKKLERAQADFDLYKSMLTKEDMNDIDSARKFRSNIIWILRRKD